jgi:hypothetical protein
MLLLLVEEGREPPDGRALRSIVPGGSLRGMAYAAPASRVTLLSVRSDLPRRM